jgi:succinylglutamic semialdehyde dehydrogenase
MTLPAFTGECFINGRWLKGGGPEFASIASADGLEVWRGNEASAADVEAAVSAARAGDYRADAETTADEVAD